MKEKLFSILIVCFLLSCGNEFVDPDSPEGILATSLTPEERERIEANEVFSAVIDNATPEEIEKILLEKGISLFLTNKEGDTVLGTAIKLQKEEIALFLLTKFQCEKLSHQNNEQESYVYLASKFGYADLIKKIADICYEVQKDYLMDGEDYEFSKLDPETKTGQKTLHVAANSLTVEAIFYGYERGGFFEWDGVWPFDFYYHTDENEQNFLHTAVADNRLDVVRWVVEEECNEIPPVTSPPSPPIEGDAWWKFWNWPGKAWRGTKEAGKWTFVKGQNFWNWVETLTDLINDEDEDGKSPLALAAESLNVEAINILSSCSWLDYSTTNLEGDIPLQIFLKALNPSEKIQRDELREGFKILAHKRTRISKYIRTTEASYVDDQNNGGDSSLHIAAGLADPFFYNYLKPLGNTLLPNNKGEKPEDIFKATQNKIKGL